MLQKVANQDIRDYFELRYDPLSEAMKSTMREAVLNKLTELSSDPHFRFILGQRKSTISFDQILDSDSIVLVNINKGSLGIHSLTLGALIYAKLRSAIFRRRRKQVFTVYADEIQNLATAGTDFEVMFSEARKFSVSVVAANQFGAQLPNQLRSAIQAIGTRVFFQLSNEDAEAAAKEIGGGKHMVDRLKNLSARHFIVRQGNHKPYEVKTPDVITTAAPGFGACEGLERDSRHATRRH